MWLLSSLVWIIAFGTAGLYPATVSYMESIEAGRTLTDKLPPIPEGFVLEQDAATTVSGNINHNTMPPLPDGFKLVPETPAAASKKRAFTNEEVAAMMSQKQPSGDASGRRMSADAFLDQYKPSSGTPVLSNVQTSKSEKKWHAGYSHR